MIQIRGLRKRKRQIVTLTPRLKQIQMYLLKARSQRYDLRFRRSRRNKYES